MTLCMRNPCIIDISAPRTMRVRHIHVCVYACERVDICVCMTCICVVRGAMCFQEEEQILRVQVESFFISCGSVLLCVGQDP